MNISSSFYKTNVFLSRRRYKMNLANQLIKIFQESSRFLLNPKKHWERVKEDKDLIEDGIRKFFVLGLVLLVLASVLGDFLFESQYGFILKTTIIKLVRKILLLALALLAGNMLLYELSRIFRIPVGFETSRKIVTYSMLPLVAVTIVTSLFPFLDVIGIVSIYSFYLVYSALNTLFDVKLENNLSYIASLLISMFVAYGIIALLLSKLTALIIY